MDNILAFEMADFRLSVALMKRGQVCDEFRSDHLYGQDAELMPEIERLLAQNDLTYPQLNLIATTQGPGSFTGLRVALATAEGLSLASGKPAVAFNSFEWIAKQYASSIKSTENDCNDSILVVLESKRKDAYCQLFDLKGEVLQEPVSLLPHELSGYITNQKAICIGSGRDRFKDAPHASNISFPEHKMPTAQDLCFFAKQQVDQFGVNAFPCEPFYLRMPDVTIP